MKERSDYKIWTTVKPRYSDQDPMQHINNVAIASYLEMGRLHLLDDVLKACSEHGTAMVLARLTVDYTGEITYPQPVDIGCRWAKIGNKSVVSHYAIFQADRCCAVSEAVNVFFDPKTRAATTPPKPVAELLQDIFDVGD